MSFSARVVADIDLTGIDALIGSIEGRVQAVIAKYANLIAEDARRLVPVDTGKLRDSITVTLQLWSAEIMADAGYAVHVEFGTARAASQPFIRPAFERYYPAFLAELQTIFL